MLSVQINFSLWISSIDDLIDFIDMINECPINGLRPSEIIRDYFVDENRSCTFVDKLYE